MVHERPSLSSLSRVDQWAKEPCCFRQRALMERDAFRLNEFARFIVDDLSNRFAVIGLLEHLMTEVYGIDFVACAKKRENAAIADSDVTETRSALINELKHDPIVRENLKYDQALYDRAREIFFQQRDAARARRIQ